MIKMKEMVTRCAIIIMTEIEDHHQDAPRFAVRGVSVEETAQFHK